MEDKEILQLWKQGLSKHKLAQMYKTSYNNRIKVIRLDIRNRHVRFITNYEALEKIEKVIYNNLQERVKRK